MLRRKMIFLTIMLVLAGRAIAGVSQGSRPPHPRYSGEDYKPGEIIVKFKPGLAANTVNAIAAAKNASVKRKLRLRNRNVYLLNTPANTERHLITRLEKNPNVEYAELNWRVYATGSLEPDDPCYPSYQWALDTIDANEGWYEISEELGFGRVGDPNIVIAILDTGVDLDHPDLENIIGTGDYAGWDFFDDDNEPDDECGHGTHCAGIAAADTNNAIGIAGVSWGCTVMPVRIFGPDGFGWIAECVEGINYASDPNHRAHVLSMSWGGAPPVSSTLTEAIKDAYNAGCVLVVSAGNAIPSFDLAENPLYPSCYDEVICVAATDANDLRSSYSCYGSPVEVAAPGDSIYSTITPSGGDYNDMSGTSMSCPHVSGLAALCLSVDSTLTNEEVRAFICDYADDIGDPDLGAGRINVYKTLNAFKKTRRPNPADESDNQSVNTNLSWTAPPSASSYDVYLGTDFNDVNDANTGSPEFEGNQPGTTFDPNTLDLITTYYWRIDANDGSSTTKGDVWDFTTEVFDPNYPVHNSMHDIWYATIQGAIDDANEDDVLIAYPHTYYENVDFNDVNCTLTGSDPNDWNVITSTIIDGNGAGNVVEFNTPSRGPEKADNWHFDSGTTGWSGDFEYWTAGSSKMMFDISGADNMDESFSQDVGVTAGKTYEVKIYVTKYDVTGDPDVLLWWSLGASAQTYITSTGLKTKTITATSTADMFVEAEYVSPQGGDAFEVDIDYISVKEVTPPDCNSELKGFTITNGQDGVHCSGVSGPTITKCIIRNNNSEGVYSSSTSPPTIKNNMIYDNDNGIRFDSATSAAAVRNNTIVNSDANGICVDSNTAPTISNCILWNNSDDLYDCNATYSCIEDGDSGTGNISTNPQFVNADANDFHLGYNSPCINVGDPNASYDGETDIDGESRTTAIVDMGADEVYRVYNSSTGQGYVNIQDAINAASNGDEIEIYPATYNEIIDSNGLAITLTGTDPNDWDIVSTTVINAGGSTNAVVLDADATLTGLTLTGATYGIYCYFSIGTSSVSNCIITNNSSCGIWLAGVGSKTIINNKICNNSTGIYQSGSSMVKNNWIYANDYGIQSVGYMEKIVRNNTLVDNTSSGIYYSSGSPSIISNCIIWDCNDDLNCTATYSCIEDGDSGTGNISSDPQFVNADANDFHIDPDTSACRQAGDPDASYSGETDIDGEPRTQGALADIGADEARRVHNTTKDLWYTSIQSAVDAADANDTIEVLTGTYYEAVEWMDKPLILTSSDPNDWSVVESTVISPADSDKNALCILCVDRNATLAGFTVTNGYHGICSVESDCTITKCVIENNKSCGILCAGDPVICGNRITNNCSPSVSWSAGIYVSSLSNPLICHNFVYENAMTGIHITSNASAVVLNNTVVGHNMNSGIVSDDPNMPVSNCILWGNKDDLSGCNATYSCIEHCIDAGGTGNICGDANDPCFANIYDFLDMTKISSTTTTIIVADASLYDINDVIEYDNDGVVRTVNDVNTTTETITFSPALDDNSIVGTFIHNWGIGATDIEENYHLSCDSPCIDAGDPNEPNDPNDYNPYAPDSVDIDGQTRAIANVVDMGADEVPYKAHNVTQDYFYYCSIQDALDDVDADDGDKIEVVAGTHYESIDFAGLNCTLTSLDPNSPDIVAATIIDANDANANVVTFANSEDVNCVMTGFTITGGSVGIDCNGTDPAVTNCFIEDNNTGVYCYDDASPAISRCVISENSDGVYISSSKPVALKNNWIYANDYGIKCSDANSATAITNDTIAGNIISGIYVSSGSEPNVSNCIIWDCNDDLSSCSATYSCISDGDGGTGNISTDPNFIDAVNDDYHLDVGSSCIDTGDPNFQPDPNEMDIDLEPRVMDGVYDGVEDETVDMGADEFCACRTYDHFYDGDIAGSPLPPFLGGTYGAPDGKVGPPDQALVNVNWGKTRTTGLNPCGDFTGSPLPPPMGTNGKPDGKCDVFEQNVLNTNWLCPDDPNCPSCFEDPNCP